MLVECCQVGTVRKIIVSHESLTLGVVAVTFESIDAATRCATKMNGRWFDGRQLETKLYFPGSTSTSSIDSYAHVEDTSGVPRDSAKITTDFDVNFSTERNVMGASDNNVKNSISVPEEPLSAEIVQEVEEVEDFLNSLL